MIDISAKNPEDNIVEVSICRFCKEIVDPSYRYCPDCGEPIETLKNEPPKPPKHSCTAEIIAELERLEELAVTHLTPINLKEIDAVRLYHIHDRIAELKLKAKETQL